MISLKLPGLKIRPGWRGPGGNLTLNCMHPVQHPGSETMGEALPTTPLLPGSPCPGLPTS